MPALDTHQRSQLMFFMRALNISRGECHHHSVGMPRRLLVDGVDQIESVPGKMALIGFRIDPDGKEFGAQVAALRFVEADVPDVVRIGRAKIKVFIEKTLWRIGVRVNYKRGVVNGARLRRNHYVARVRGHGRSLSRKEGEGEEQSRDRK